MTDDDLATLFADPPADLQFVTRVAALVRLEQIHMADRARAWRRFRTEAAGTIAIAAAAGVIATMPAAGWPLLLMAGALPTAWLLAGCRPVQPTG